MHKCMISIFTAHGVYLFNVGGHKCLNCQMLCSVEAILLAITPQGTQCFVFIFDLLTFDVIFFWMTLVIIAREKG
ncbi:MAG: hypothetical protein UW39_C0012G0023 [Parcubacteria group bacterium GW2011_GWC2_44_17]|nr:MAG: hypothetical protein UW39_C0012G0023 [Parcubacteria group bacterium GW2011_GWC2_44_17]